MTTYSRLPTLFHVFGGKAALVDQLDAITRDKASRII